MNEPLIVKPSTENRIDYSLMKMHGETPRRDHLSFKQCAYEDLRQSWLDFRWSLPVVDSALRMKKRRMKSAIKAEAVSLLRTITGLEWHTHQGNGAPYRYELLGGHFSAVADGVVIGVPESPVKWHIGSIQVVHNDQYREFLKMDKDVRRWNKAVFTEVQTLMGVSGLDRAIVIIYNRDTAEISTKRLKPTPGHYENSQVDATDLIEVRGHPTSAYSPNHPKIKRMKPTEWQRIYWGAQLPKPNCRNCKHSRVSYGGNKQWDCSRWNKPIPNDIQAIGCRAHLYMKPFVPLKQLEDCGNYVRYVTADNVEIWNSEDASVQPTNHVYDSGQLCAMTEQTDEINNVFLNDPTTLKLREKLEGTFA